MLRCTHMATVGFKGWTCLCQTHVAHNQLNEPRSSHHTVILLTFSQSPTCHTITVSAQTSFRLTVPDTTTRTPSLPHPVDVAWRHVETILRRLQPSDIDWYWDVRASLHSTDRGGSKGWPGATAPCENSGPPVPPNDTIRYDTIAEFNVDWKAEYSALSSTRSQKKKLKQPTPVPL